MKLETNGHIGVDFWQGSMSDIAFLLIIFFILTALFTVPYVLRFISGGKDSTIVEKTDLSVIEIDQDGVMLFDGKPLERQRLAGMLDPARYYRLKVADGRPYQEFTGLLDVVNGAGISRIEVVTHR